MFAQHKSGGIQSQKAMKIDAVVYNYVKSMNPSALMDVFTKEKCRDLEKRDHLYGLETLTLMLSKYRRDLKKQSVKEDSHAHQNVIRAKEVGLARIPLPKPKSPAAQSKAPVDRTYNHDLLHRSFCLLSDPKKSLELTIYNHFLLAGDEKALNLLFDDKSRVEYGGTVEMIDVPSVLRMVAHRRWKTWRELSANRSHPEIFMCQFCKKEVMGFPKDLKRHIGMHEDIPSYCFVEGCDKHFKQVGGLGTHLLRTHQLYVNDLSPEQYHHLHALTNAFSKKAGQFLDRYFPPESFVAFSENKMGNVNELEDPNCTNCGEIVKSATTRRLHVAAHLHLTYKCVIRGCEGRVNPISISTHLKCHHKKRVNQLGVMELDEYKKMRQNFTELMKEEIPKYFPRRLH